MHRVIYLNFFCLRYNFVYFGIKSYFNNKISKILKFFKKHNFSSFEQFIFLTQNLFILNLITPLLYMEAQNI